MAALHMYLTKQRGVSDPESSVIFGKSTANQVSLKLIRLIIQFAILFNEHIHKHISGSLAFVIL